MKKNLLKSLLLGAALLVGSSVWADDVTPITSFPFSTDFSTSTSPFNAGDIVTSNASIGAVLNVANTTASAFFDSDTSIDGNQAYTLASKETVTVSFTAFHGWQSKASNQTVSLLNSDGVSLVEYVYDLNGCKVTAVNFAGTSADGFTAFAGQSKYNASKSANGISGNGYPYVATANYNPTVTMSVAANGYVTFKFVSANAGEKSFSTTLGSDVKKDLAEIRIKDPGNGDRSICIDNLSITKATAAKEQYPYTVVYKDQSDNSTIKSEGGVGDEGTTVAISHDDFTYGGKKYNWVSDNSAEKTLDAADLEITVVCKEAAKYAYSVKAVDEESNVLKTILATSDYVGNTVSYAYPRYINVSGTLYEQAAVSWNGAPLKGNLTLDADNKVANVTYSATTITDVVFLVEGEDIEGVNKTSAGNIGNRASGAAAGYTTSEVTITTLPAGVYSMFVDLSSPVRTHTYTFNGAGVAIASSDFSKSNHITKTLPFTLTGETTIKLLSGAGDGDDGLDYLYIQKVSTVSKTVSDAGYATYYTDAAALDFANATPAGLEAYIATANDGESVTLTKVDDVPAGTGVLLKGAANTYEIPVIGISETVVTGNKFVGVTADTPVTESIYVLYKQGSDVGFYKTTAATFTVGANTAYLPALGGSANLRLVFEGEEATGIHALNAAETEEGAVYNVAGQRVSDGYKGIVIKNGKKYLRK